MLRAIVKKPSVRQVGTESLGCAAIADNAKLLLSAVPEIVTCILLSGREEFRPEATSARTNRFGYITDIARDRGRRLLWSRRDRVRTATTLAEPGSESLKRQCNEERCENKKLGNKIEHEICSGCIRNDWIGTRDISTPYSILNISFYVIPIEKWDPRAIPEIDFARANRQ